LLPVTTGAIAFSAGGCSAAASHCVAPTYERPDITTEPSHHSCAATHSIES
jgi:hypothetical protein